MAMASNATKNISKILLLWSDSTAKNIQFSSIILFAQLLALNQYVCKNIITTDAFLLIIPNEALEEFLNDPVYSFPQVYLIFVYYENDNDLIRDRTRLQAKYTKLRFCRKRNVLKELEKVKMDDAITPSNSIDRAAIEVFASSVSQRVSDKLPTTASRHSPERKRSTHGFSVKNIEQINPSFICPSCELVFREPYQLDCGHRTCQSCIYTENNQISCVTRSIVVSDEKAWLDRGLRNDMEKLSISCSVCDWTGCLEVYQEHLDQDHPDREHVTVTIDADAQEIDRIRLREHVYTAKTREQIPLDILSSSCSIYTPNNSETVHSHHHILFSRIQQIISSLFDSVNMQNHDQQRISNEFRHSQNLIQVVTQNLPLLQASFEENVSLANGFDINQDLLGQAVRSLQQIVNDRLLTSSDGTIIWKITAVDEKIANARSERQKSIYSPPFYSSSTGYKMCLQLYLNGNGDASNTHLSLFFVIMRGDYDAILQWPFPYEVKFCLFDQLTLNGNQRHIANSFWPDLSLSCFKRPILGMNEAYGIERFFSLGLFEQSQNLYVRDNTMFIKAELDFLSARPASIQSSATAGLPDDSEHIGTVG